MEKTTVRTLRFAAALAALLLPAGAARCGDLSADTVVADRVEAHAVGPDAAAPGLVLMRDGASVAGALSAAGAAGFADGIAFLPPLGDVPMGAFTNAAGDAACAGAPAWWSTRGVTPAGAAANDRAAAVQGQVKWIALQAAAELDAALAAAGGAGPAVSALAASFSPSNNLLPVTLGQLKNTARPFHDRLMEVGIATGYPWSGPASDFALANAGQVKLLFSFDLSALDSDGDGLTNLQENGYGTDPLKKDTDGDGYSDDEEILAGMDPFAADTGAGGSVRYSYDDDSRLSAAHSGTNQSASVSILTPAGNASSLHERRGQ
jgi:hypothetical protein